MFRPRLIRHSYTLRTGPKAHRLWHNENIEYLLEVQSLRPCVGAACTFRALAAEEGPFPVNVQDATYICAFYRRIVDNTLCKVQSQVVEASCNALAHLWSNTQKDGSCALVGTGRKDTDRALRSEMCADRTTMHRRAAGWSPKSF